MSSSTSSTVTGPIPQQASSHMVILTLTALLTAFLATSITYMVNQWGWKLFENKPWQDVVPYLIFIFIVILMAIGTALMVCGPKGSSCKWSVLILMAVIAALVCTLPPLIFGFQSSTIASWMGDSTYTVGDSVFEIGALFATFFVVLLVVMAASCKLRGSLRSGAAKAIDYVNSKMS